MSHRLDGVQREVVSPNRAYLVYSLGGAYSNTRLFDFKNKRSLQQGFECSKELVLLLRHKIARVAAAPAAGGARGSNEPASAPWRPGRGRGRGGRGG
eukprot:15450275-Alexandrium_andersonii.AAC.1